MPDTEEKLIKVTCEYSLIFPANVKWSIGRTIIPQYLWGIPKSAGAQVPYIKWPKTMHTVNPPHSRIPNHKSKILYSMLSWLNLQMQTPWRRRADSTLLGTPNWSGTVLTQPSRSSDG